MHKELDMDGIDDAPTVLCKYGTSELISMDEFTMIKGVQGSGKSRFAMNLVAGLAGYKGMEGFEFTEFPEDKHIIIMSTEMSDRALRNRLNGVKEATGTLNRIHVYNTIEDGANLDKLIPILDKYPPHAIIIDHVLDYIQDMNNIEQSTSLCSRIGKMAKYYNCAVIGIIHQNPDSKAGSKAGGHIGSMLERKAIAVFAVEPKHSPADPTKSHYLISLTKIREGESLLWVGRFNNKYKFFDLKPSIKEILKNDNYFDKIIFNNTISNIGDQLQSICGVSSVNSKRKIIKAWIDLGLIYEEKIGNKKILKKVINEDENQ